MAQRTAVKTIFEIANVVEPIYTGGAIQLSEDGQILATSLGEEALLTDFQNGRRLARIEGDGEALTTLALTPSASHLVLCSRSLSMRIFALDRSSPDHVTAKLERTLKPHTSPVVSTTIDKSGTLLATGGADGVVKVWDIRGGYTTHTLHGHSGVISALHFFKIDPNRHNSVPNGHIGRNKSKQHSNVDNIESGEIATFRLASGDEEGKVRIWHLQKRKCIAILDSHVSVVRALDFDENDQALLSGSRDKTAMVWDSLDWTVRTTLPVLESLETVGFLSEQRLLFTGGENGVIRLWNIVGQEITEEQQKRPEEQSITYAIHAASVSGIVAIHADHTIMVHTITDVQDRDLKTPALPIVRHISGTHDEIIDAAYVGGEGQMLAIATNTEEIKLISVTSKNESHTGNDYFGADVGLLQGHSDIIISLDVDWSGHWLATGAKDNTARLWRLDTETRNFDCAAIFTGHAESLGAVALPKQRPTKTSQAETEPLNHVPAFLITGSQDKTIKRWNTSSLKSSSIGQNVGRADYTRKAHDKDINALDVSFDNRLFASASQDKIVKIWSVEVGESVGVLRGHKRGVWSVAFAPKEVSNINNDAGASGGNRGYVVTASGDKTVKLWSLSDYSCIRTFEGHTNTVLKVVWLPAAPQIMRSDGDDDMYLDDEDEEDTQLQKKEAEPLSPPQIASSGSDGLVKIWDAGSGECACTLDNHTDRVWALAVAPNPSTPSLNDGQDSSSLPSKQYPSRMLVSGAADATITLWKDTTHTTYTKQTAEANERVEQDQALQNYIRADNYREAIVLALQLNHPARLLALFTSVVKKHPPEPDSLTGVHGVDEVIGNLGDEQLLTLLNRIRDWNVNARTSLVAQRLLWALLRLYPASKFTKLKGGKKDSGSMRDVLDALRVYTERHYRRWEEMMDQSWLVEFTLGQMDELTEGTHSNNISATNGTVSQLSIDGAKPNGIKKQKDEDVVMMVD